MKRTIDDVRFLNIKTIVDDNGNLVPIESGEEITHTTKQNRYLFVCMVKWK